MIRRPGRGATATCSYAQLFGSFQRRRAGSAQQRGQQRFAVFLRSFDGAGGAELPDPFERRAGLKRRDAAGGEDQAFGHQGRIRQFQPLFPAA